MRNLLFLLGILSTALLNAQTAPLDQFFTTSTVPGIVPYDSISVSQDSGSNFITTSTGAQHYFTNGHIDTLIETQSGIPVSAYGGTVNGRTTTIIGRYLGSNQIIDKMVVMQDSLFRDSSVAYYDHNGSTYQLFFEVVVTYTSPTSNRVDKTDIYADLGSGLVRIGGQQHFYGSQGIDSIFFSVSVSGAGDGFVKYNYHPTIPGRLISIDDYQDIDNDGEPDLTQQFLPKYNQLNQVVEVTELGLDNNDNFILYYAYRFSKRQNSTIGLPDLGPVKISVYPNPAYDYLQIESSKDAFEGYSIYDLTGIKVMEGKLDKRLDIQTLSRGYYILQLEGSKGYTSMKFEKM